MQAVSYTEIALQLLNTSLHWLLWLAIYGVFMSNLVDAYRILQLQVKDKSFSYGNIKVNFKLFRKYCICCNKKATAKHRQIAE